MMTEMPLQSPSDQFISSLHDHIDKPFRVGATVGSAVGLDVVGAADGFSDGDAVGTANTSKEVKQGHGGSMSE